MIRPSCVIHDIVLQGACINFYKYSNIREYACVVQVYFMQLRNKKYLLISIDKCLENSIQRVIFMFHHNWCKKAIIAVARERKRKKEGGREEEREGEIERERERVALFGSADKHSM